jgi:uncharacterized protein
MYAQTIPTLQKNLAALTKFLKKAEAHVDAQKLDKSVVLGLRVYPDMFPLLRQVLLVADFSKGAGARLAGVAVPSFPDDEKTFDDLYGRIAKTEAFLASLDAKSFEGAETREITMKIGGEEMKFPGQVYLSNMALPNIYFHMTTAYNLLRGIGVPLGKGDFMGR